jgi:DNA repair exonuclease SbcCD ATPase subunit
MNIDKLENPFIKVTWEDIPENFTQEKVKRVRSYFQRKYNSKNVTILTKAIDRNSTGELDIDIEENVMDTSYQKNLMEQFVKNNSIGVDIDLLKRLDDRVNSKMSDEVNVNAKYKRVYVKKIKFSNFLSFGKDNILDVSSLGGITVIDSNPPNFGGKSVLAVDLILFLFFNSTTKSSKAIDIFNRFTKTNEVFVQGEVEIDGKDYIIIRKIKRKKTKRGEWSVSTSLEFLQIEENGNLKNFTGEQRRETETFIKESIGTMNDFLLTVLTTAGNLESLIESKPTERGNILSRFVGLEILKDKESIVKKMYSEWSKKIISNLYNIEDLKHNIKKLKEEKTNLIKENDNNNLLLLETKKSTKEKNEGRDELLSKKSTDIDTEIENTNPRLVGEEINSETKLLDVMLDKLKLYGDNEMPEEVNLENLRENITKRDTLVTQNIKDKTNLKNLEITLKSLEDSEVCPMCKQNLKDVDHSEEIKKLTDKIKNLKKVTKKDDKTITSYNSIIEELNNKKLLFDEYEKDILKKERLVLEIDQKKLNIEKLSNRLKKWEENKSKLENNNKIDKLVMTIKSEIDVLNNKKEQLIRSIEENKSRCKVIEETNKTDEDRINTINKENDVDKVFRAYLTVYGKNGIIKTIMKSVVPKLNNELTTLLSDVTKFSVKIKVNDKNEVDFWMVDNDSGVEKLLSTGSGYEKTMASLAIRTVLTKVSCLPRPNVTVFDEVLGKVSNENLEEVGMFFNRIKEYFENILLITHNPLVREWSDNIVTVTKEKNISRII